MATLSRICHLGQKGISLSQMVGHRFLMTPTYSGDLVDESGKGNTPPHKLQCRARYKEREKRRGEGEPKDEEEYGQDEFGDVMDLVMGSWMRHAPKHRPEQEIAHVPEVDHSEQRVQDWLESS